MNLDDLTFDAAGLIPAVVQDFFTRDVLTVAYMNRESLAITLAEGRTCFWSRSRQELWRKGETSGNVQYVVSVRADCDGDALVVEVVKDGPACHLGTDSCFTKQLFKDESVQRFTLDALYALLCERNERRPEGSYTTYLFAEGTEKILKKVGEEATEVIIAAMKGDEGETDRRPVLSRARADGGKRHRPGRGSRRTGGPARGGLQGEAGRDEFGARLSAHGEDGKEYGLELGVA